MAYQSPDSYRGVINRAKGLIGQANRQMGKRNENGNHMPVTFFPDILSCLAECGVSRAELEGSIHKLKPNSPKVNKYREWLEEINKCIEELEICSLKFGKPLAL